MKRLTLAALLLLSAGCELDSSAGLPDGSGDGSGADAGTGVDAGSDASADVAADVATDAEDAGDTALADVADVGGPDAADTGADTGGGDAYLGDYRGIPPRAEVATTEVGSKTLRGRQSTDPDDEHAGRQDPEIVDADSLGNLAIAVLWADTFYPDDDRYNDSNWPVRQLTVAGFGGDPLPAYRIEPAQTAATEFRGWSTGLFYRFDAAVDWRVYELAAGALDQVAEVAAADVNVGGYTRLPTLNMDQFSRTRTLVFARADRHLSADTPLGTGGVEGGRLADNGAGRIVQIRYPLPGTPPDTLDEYPHGPSTWNNQYGDSRGFHPVRRTEGPGVVWQDTANGDVWTSWLSDTSPGTVTNVRLPGVPGSALVAAASDDAGAVTTLFVQTGDGRPNATRAVTVIRSDAAGVEARRALLDASAEGIDIVQFGGSDHAVMQRSGDRLGVVITRTIHQTPDGLNHQAGTTFVLDADTLAITGPRRWDAPDAPIGPTQTSSHDFANVLQPGAAAGEFLGADLGDAAPRGVNVYRVSDAGLITRVVFTFKTRHGTTPAAYEGGPTYPVYSEISGGGTTYYQWSNDNSTYTELGGIAPTDAGIVVLFSTERSILNNGRLGALWNETRDLAMVLLRTDFTAGDWARQAWVPDDQILSTGEPAVESRYYFFTGNEQPQRVTGVVFLTSLGADESASRPHLHRSPAGVLAVYEVWRTTRTERPGEDPLFSDTYVDTRAVRLGDNGMPVDGGGASLGGGVRLANRDDPFTLAGGTALAIGSGPERELVVTLVLPPE